MLRELIDKLKAKKIQLQNSTINNNTINNKSIAEQSNFEMTISSENNFHKIEISDYISVIDFVDKKNSSDEYNILDLLCNYVLWNNKNQKINKGTYYVIIISNHIYNILFTDEKIKIDEQIKIKRDKLTQKENIIQERAITFNRNDNDYHYFSAKHDKTGNTFYTGYYDKNRLYSLGALDLSKEETYDEVNSIIYNLENIEGIETILDIELLKVSILEDLSKNPLQRKKV